MLAIISACLNSPARCQESEDSQIFISGFNAYQQKDYATTISRMTEVLQNHPDSPLRDMVLFWLSRAYYKNGNQQDAARYMSQFLKEYPDNPLKGTVDEELLQLTARYDRGEKLAGGGVTAAARAEAAEKARLAEAQKAEQARLAAVRAEEERRAAVQAEAERREAARKAEDARLAAVKSEEQRRLAEQARLAEVQKAEQQRAAAAAAEQARAAALKAEQERPAVTQKAEEKVDMAQVARQQEELVRQALAKTEQKRLAALKAEEERQAADRLAKAEMVRQMTAKAEAEQKAAAAEEKRLAAIKAEEDRVANEKADRLRAEREKIENERKAALAAEQARLATAKAEADRKAVEAARRAEAEREKAETAKRAAAEAELKKQAAQKAEQERLAVQRAEKERQAAVAAAAAEPAPAPKKQPQKPAGKKAQLREKAIAQYQSVVEKYPGSKAAASAAAKLKELGVAPPQQKVAAVAPVPVASPAAENAQVLRLEVAQFAGLDFSLTAPAQPVNAAGRVSIPFELRNQGNGSDSFYLESGFPAEYAAQFSSAGAPDQPINQTPSLAAGETFKGVVAITIPSGSIDGQRIMYPVKATSRSFTETAQTREVRVVAAAPLLRAVVKADRGQLLPGERVAYRVSILNVGSTAAQDVAFRLSFPPQLEPLDAAAAGFRQELKASLAIDGLQVRSGESRDFTLTFQLKDDTLAGQELLTRGELVNNRLKTAAAFVSNGVLVQQKRGVTARAVAERQIVIPGQSVTVPFVVANTGNVREKFRVVPATGGLRGSVVLFHDQNRDGIRQSGEPVVTEIGPLAPREEAGIGMEVVTPRDAADGSEETARVAFISDGDEAKTITVGTRLLYSRPVLQLAMAGRDGRLKPGEVSSFDLTVSNRGSNLARTVELQSLLPEQLELVAADPQASAGSGSLTWRFKELGAGEKRTVKVSIRVRPGTVMGTSLQVKNTLAYEDQLGNRY